MNHLVFRIDSADSVDLNTGHRHLQNKPPVAYSCTDASNLKAKSHETKQNVIQKNNKVD